MSKVILKNKKLKANASNPTLDTIKMVEQMLSKISQYPSKNSLWRALPRQVQYPTFKAVLDYLEESNKIMYDKDRAIVWIFADNIKLKKLLKTSKSLL
ncbi:MAG: hypothetical protein WAN47_07305 [Nitrosotalea sp.]